MLYQVEVLGYYTKRKAEHRVKWQLLTEATDASSAAAQAVDYCQTAAPSDRLWTHFTWHSVAVAKTPMIVGASDSASAPQGNP